MAHRALQTATWRCRVAPQRGAAPSAAARPRPPRRPAPSPDGDLGTSLLVARFRGSSKSESQAAQPPPQQPPPQATALPPPSDPFVTAAARLQEVMREASWDSGEQLRQDLLSLPTESRMALFTNVSTILLTAALILNFLTTDDPLGGMSLSEASVAHALLGAGLAAPLAGASALCRAPFVRARAPLLEALHDAQEQALEPMFRGLDAPQLLILACCVSLPALLLLLPATTAGFVSAGQLLQDKVLSPMGVHVPRAVGRELSVLVPAMSSAYFTGMAVARQLSVKREQYAAIQSAVEHSERYFRLTEATAAGARVGSGASGASGGSGSSGSGSPLTAAAAGAATSQAFRALSAVWILTRRGVCRLAFAATALNVAYVAAIWNVTGDLAAPLGCAVAAASVELALCRAAADDKARRRRLRRTQAQ